MDQTPTLRTHPWYSGRFVGRDTELRAVSHQVGPGRTVAVLGPGGVGKTRFVTEVLRGRTLRSAFVDASAARRPEQLIGALIHDLGAVGTDPIGSVVERLEQAGIELLFVDCLEGLGSDAAPVLARLVNAARGVVYTSRVAIGAPDEHRITLAPLDDPDDQVEVFLQAAPRRGPLELHPVADRAAVAAVVSRLDGLPLAIELAAGRLAVLSLHQLRARMVEAPARHLRDPSRPIDRGTALWQSIAWSVELLPGGAADVLEQLAAFAGPFDLDAARAVVATEDVADGLQILLAWHLVRADGERFVLYDSVREFATHTLQQRVDVDVVTDRHGEHFLNRIRADGRASEPHLGAVRAVLHELDAVIERGLAAGASAARLFRARSVVHVTYFVDRERHTRVAHDARLAALLAAGPPEAVSLDLAADRLRLFHLTDPNAETRARELLELARQLDAPLHGLWAGLHLAKHAASRGDEAAARAWSEPALVQARALGYRVMEAQLLMGPINLIPMLHGRHGEVEARMALAEQLVVDEMDPTQRGQILLHVGVFYLNVGRWDDARSRFDRAFACSAVVHGTQTHDLGLWLYAMMEVGEAGPGWLERVEALALRMSPRLSGERRECFDLILAVARRLGGGTPVAFGFSAGWSWDIELGSLVLAAAQALDRGPVVLPPERSSDPAARAVRAAAELVQAVVGGTIGGEEAQAAACWPPCLWLHPLRWILETAIRERAERDAAWWVHPTGRWYRAPGAGTEELTPLLSRLLGALVGDQQAGGNGLDVDALFTAGWPGERAGRAAAANRVRVAVTTLRQRGFPIGWARGRGWSFSLPIRTSDAPPP